jgi:hypothetical protein
MDVRSLMEACAAVERDGLEVALIRRDLVA